MSYSERLGIPCFLTSQGEERAVYQRRLFDLQQLPYWSQSQLNEILHCLKRLEQDDEAKQLVATAPRVQGPLVR